MQEIKVTLQEFSKSVYALPGTELFECISRAGVLIRTPCGGKGTCGKCAVQVVAGKVQPTSSCKSFFSEDEITAGWRLACCAKITEDITISIPTSTLYESDTVAVVNSKRQSRNFDNEECRDGVCAPIKKLEIELTPATLENPISDLDNLFSKTGIKNVPVNILKQLPKLLRENNHKLNVVCSKENIISIESPGSLSCYALAIDIGTTTVAAGLINLNTGKLIAGKGTLNPQVKYGEDILSRIAAQSESESVQNEMAAVISDACNELIYELIKDGEIEPSHIYGAVIAGNTAMQMIFCGIPVKALGEIPFVPPFVRNMKFTASELNLNMHPNAEIIMMPLLGGFVGGDITAGIIASEMIEDKNNEVILFVDVGTNGEIVLKKGDKLYASAAAAGPAFEGAGISNGMRAGKGAIEKVVIRENKVRYNVIGNIEPKGICGTALIDIASEMLKNNLLDETGRIKTEEEYLSEDGVASLAKHLTLDNEEPAFRLPQEKESTIVIKQKDIRNLQLASGAIRATTNILMKKAGVNPEDIDKLYIAGGFGNFIRQSNAKRIGLIPNLPDEKIFFIGNSSLLGAEMVMIKEAKLDDAINAAELVEVIDVSLDIEFQMEFAGAMIFPSE
jgi:uncharacterized 2Fe-2S/4Fe-4S cluster protein (DUF4445 family)